MQQVPELVFLNCCHIGQTGPEASAAHADRRVQSPGRKRFPRIDRDGRARGRRSRLGRQGRRRQGIRPEVLRKHARRRNFRPRAQGGPQPHATTTSATAIPGAPTRPMATRIIDSIPAVPARRPTGLDRVDVAEFIEAVDGIGRTAEDGTGAGRSPSTAVKTLDALVKDCPTDWLAQTDVQMAIGYAYGRLKQFDSRPPITSMTALAGEGDTSTTTMLAVEKLANLRGAPCRRDCRRPGRACPRVVRVGHRAPRATSCRCRDSGAVQLARKRVQAPRRRRTELQNGQEEGLRRRPKTTGRRIFSCCSARAWIHTPR